jgi:hypothetical protein
MTGSPRTWRGRTRAIGIGVGDIEPDALRRLIGDLRLTMSQSEPALTIARRCGLVIRTAVG